MYEFFKQGFRALLGGTVEVGLGKMQSDHLDQQHIRLERELDRYIEQCRESHNGRYPPDNDPHLKEIRANIFATINAPRRVPIQQALTNLRKEEERQGREEERQGEGDRTNDRIRTYSSPFTEGIEAAAKSVPHLRIVLNRRDDRGD